MAGTPDDPFLETVAECDLCLDLKQTYLRRQWRRFGRLPAFDVPYGFTLRKLDQNVEESTCWGCRLVSRAVTAIHDDLDIRSAARNEMPPPEDLELPLEALRLGHQENSRGTIEFHNARLEFLDDDGLDRLSIALSTIYPTYASKALWELATTSKDISIEMYTGRSKADPDRKLEYKMTSPQYEIYIPSGPGQELARHPKLWNSIKGKEVRSNNTGSDEAVQWTLSKLKACTAHHSMCSSEETSPSLPTRVLDLGEDLTHTEASPRLLVPNGERAEYVCLSHCWGPPELRPLETTLETLEAHQIEISWAGLPQTFKDAISFTRRLGIRYLWIDSLCIVQNDIADWMKEAGRMATVYQNARLTLAAASSKNSHQGLFRRLNPEVRLDSNGIVATGESPGIFARRFPDPEFFRHRSVEDNSKVDRVSPLIQRAWVFQERILSRRVLFFTPLELVMECREARYTESGHVWIDSSVKQAFNVVYDHGSTQEALANTWKSLVEDYTSLALTRRSDLLPAIAGLAQAIYGPRGRTGEYLAGLWRSTFVEDLLWERRQISISSIHVNRQIPTWSWARSAASKKYPARRVQSHLCHVVTAECLSDKEAGSKFLHVSSGYAELSGYLLPATMTTWGIELDGLTSAAYQPKADYPYFEDSNSLDGEPTIANGERVFLLPLVVQESSMQDETELASLILRPDGKDDYRRIGLVSIPLLEIGGYEYILEDRKHLIDALKAQVEFGERLLGEDERYHKDESRSHVPLWMKNGEELRLQLFEQAAWNRFDPQDDKKSSFEDFFGKAYLDLLRREFRQEENRVDEWCQGSQADDTPSCRRRSIRLV